MIVMHDIIELTIDKHNDDYDDRRHDNKRRCVVPNYGGGVDMTNMVGQQGGPPPHAFQMLQVCEGWVRRNILLALENIFSPLSGREPAAADPAAGAGEASVGPHRHQRVPSRPERAAQDGRQAGGALALLSIS